VGDALPIGLVLPWGESFADANVGRLFVRTVALQEDVPVRPGVDGRVRHLLLHAGPTLVVVSAGPGKDRNHPRSWSKATHTSKAFLRVTGGSAATPWIDPGTTAKVGLPIELMPLVAPLRMRPGAYLPVRAYFRNDAAAGAVVRAHRDDGSTISARTDAVGTTVLPVDRPGRWMFRFEKRAGGVDHMAELVFDVPGSGGTQ